MYTANVNVFLLENVPVRIEIKCSPKEIEIDEKCNSRRVLPIMGNIFTEITISCGFTSG